MSKIISPIERLEVAIKGLGLKPEQVLVGTDGETIRGYSVVITNATDLVELMRRTHELSAEFVPNPVTDEQFVVYLREGV